MFEKEAEDSFNCKKVLYKWETDKRSYIDGFKDGAEFGYNKAKEDADKMKSQFLELCNLKDMRIADLEKANKWHYVKDGDLPKDEDWKWCVSYRGYYYVAKYEEMFGCWTNQEYSEVMQPYAWKKIVLPELKESD